MSDSNRSKVVSKIKSDINQVRDRYNKSSANQAKRPTVKPLPSATVSTSKYIPGSEKKGRPIEQPKRPERDTSFYEQRTETVPFRSGQGLTKQEFIGVVQRADIQDKQQTIQEIRGLPKGTRFMEKTEKDGMVSYEVSLPESVVLDRSQAELKRFEDYPPVIKEVSRTGYFITQGMYASVKPVFQLFGKEKEFDVATGIGSAVGSAPFQPEKQIKYTLESEKKGKYGVHYVSPMDYVFEPIGWSPKGSTDVLKKYPVESTVGGLGAEFAQSVVIGAAAGKIGKSVISPGTKALVRGGSKAVYKFSKVFPEEKIISKGVKSFSKTSFGRNMYQWATKGYTPVQRLTGTGVVKSTEKVIEGDMASTRVISRRLLEGGGKRLERVFVSPAEASRATRELSKKLGGRMSINFPRTPDLAQSYLKTTKVKGVFTKRLVSTEKVFYTTWKKPLIKPSKEFIETGFVFGGRKQPGFIRAGKQEFTKFLDDVSDSTYVTRMKPYEARIRVEDILDVEKTMGYGIDDIYDVGRGGFPYRKVETVGGVYEKRVMKPVSVVPGTRSTKAGFFTGPSPDDPMSAWAKSAAKWEKQWVSRQRWKYPLKALKKDVRGIQRIVPTVDTTVFQKPVKSSGMGRLGLIRQRAAPALKVDFPVAPVAGVGYIEAKGFYRFLQPNLRFESKKDRRIETVVDTEKDFESIIKVKPDVFNIPDEEVIITPIKSNDIDEIIESITETKKKTKQEQIAIPFLQTKTKASYKPSYLMKPSVKIKMPYIPSKSMSGRGKNIVSVDGFNELYKFRGFDLPNPLKKSTKKKRKGMII